MNVHRAKQGNVEIWRCDADDSSFETSCAAAREILQIASKELIPLHRDVGWDVFRFELIGYNGLSIMYPARLPIVEGKNPRFDHGEIDCYWPRLRRVWQDPSEDDLDEDGVRINEDEWLRDVARANDFIIEAFNEVFREFSSVLKPIAFTSGARTIRTLQP